MLLPIAAFDPNGTTNIDSNPSCTGAVWGACVSAADEHHHQAQQPPWSHLVCVRVQRGRALPRHPRTRRRRHTTVASNPLGQLLSHPRMMLCQVPASVQARTRQNAGPQHARVQPGTPACLASWTTARPPATSTASHHLPLIVMRNTYEPTTPRHRPPSVCSYANPHLRVM